MTERAPEALENGGVTTDQSAAKVGIFREGRDGNDQALLSIEEASILKQASRKSSHATSAQAAASKNNVWGPNGADGIPPEELIAQQRKTLTHSWGPKPAWMTRPCRMKEGNVTKRIRMDRDRLAGVGSKKQWTSNGNAARVDDFRPVALAVVQQQDRPLVGLPRQRVRTRALSTDPVQGRAGNNPAGEWALRQVVEQAGGGGPAITVYGHDLGVGIWPRQRPR